MTTVLKMYGGGKVDALMYWAWEQGRDGHDFRETRDDAASIGTLVHAAIEGRLRAERGGEIKVPSEWQDWFGNAVQAFEEWRAGSKLVVTETEASLVSERHRFGGTLDWPATASGRRVIADLKTSSGVYTEHRIQLAAYGLLWDETHPDDPVTGGYHLLQVGKKDGSFAHHYWPDLIREREVFLLLRRLYDLDKEIA